MCIRCFSMNPISLARYRLKSVSPESPSMLVQTVVSALKEGPMDSHELLARLRKARIRGDEHILKAEVLLALEYLMRRGAVVARVSNRTQETFDALRSRAWESGHLGLCPAELKRGIKRRSLISLYAQRWTLVPQYGRDYLIREKRLVRAGVLCPACDYHDLDRNLVR